MFVANEGNNFGGRLTSLPQTGASDRLTTIPLLMILAGLALNILAYKAFPDKKTLLS